MTARLAIAYLQLEPEWTYGSRDVASSVRAVKVVNVTQTRPKKPKPGTVVVKVNIEVAAEAFLPLTPEATIVIPTNLTDPHPVDVTAVDPSESSTS